MNANRVRLPMAALGLLVVTPSIAQQAAPPPRWKPGIESVTVSAMSAMKNLRVVMSGSRIGSEAFAVTASIPVPYSDLKLTRDADADEFTRRIGVAAQLVCTELDVKYPRAQYPIIMGDDCVQTATSDGMVLANQVIAAARK